MKQTDDDAFLGALVDYATPSRGTDPEALLIERAVREHEKRVRQKVLGAFALAACLVAGIAIALRKPATTSTPPTAAEQLAAAIETLRGTDADLFGDFALVDAASVPSIDRTTRGGLVWRAPLGVVLEKPAQLTWRNPTGAQRVRLQLEGPDWSWTQDVGGTSVDAPDMPPGKIVVTVTPLDGFARQPVRSTFEIASSEARDRYARAVAQIRASSPAPVRDLVELHYAVQRRHYDRARAAARRASDGDPAVAALAAPLLSRLGPGR